MVTPKVAAKLELLIITMRWVYQTSNMDLSSTKKCDQNHCHNCCEFDYTLSCSKAQAFDHQNEVGLSNI